jgi:hypothetical protein
MSNLRFNVDVKGIVENLAQGREEAEAALKEGVRGLATMTHAKTMELASEELNSTSVKYRKALSFQQVAEDIYVVSLDESLLWLEDGRKAGEMINDLLKKNAKISKEGFRYKAIPFDYSSSTPKSQRTQFSASMVNLVQRALKERNLPYKKLEVGRDGKPLLGKLHTMNIASPRPTATASHDALAGLNVYQHMDEGGNARRSMVAYRMVSDKHSGTGKWVHPGIPAKQLMDKALAWAEREFETKILPEIMSKF